MFEDMRLCQGVTGYDYLAAVDHHWHRSGYSVGVMNEFYEMKPGESGKDVLRYNGESVILLECGRQRNLTSGVEVRYDVFASLFGDGGVTHGALQWTLADAAGRVLARGEIELHDVPNGRIERLGSIAFTAPLAPAPGRRILHARLSGGEYEIVNDWDFWVFPERTPPMVEAGADDAIAERLGGLLPGLAGSPATVAGRLRIVSALDEATLSFIERGGRVLLLGADPFPSLPLISHKLRGGRTIGNAATVIADHPLTRRFPHDGFCDWQFLKMLDNGRMAVFNELSIPFEPIIEVVSSYKYILKQECLFELRVGKGGLLVWGLNIAPSDPASLFLLDTMVAYLEGEEFATRTSASPDAIRPLLRKKMDVVVDSDTDYELDANAQLGGRL
jgi:hypothetical protein